MVVKLNCEGCEHHIIDGLSQIPRLDVKKIAVQFHDIKGRSAYESLVSLEDKASEFQEGGEMCN
jgi:copper chaperone CopZ